MRLKFLYSALILVLLSNMIVFAGVAWNRTQFGAAILLTERELYLTNRYFRKQENSGISLQLKIHQDSHSPDWLNAGKLSELGFQPDRYKSIEMQKKKPRSRIAWLVLEYDGPSWQVFLDESVKHIAQLEEETATNGAELKQVEIAKKELQNDRNGSSRLIAIDAGIDANQLQERYQDSSRYLIHRAKVRMMKNSPDGGVKVHGYLTLLDSNIHAPLQYHSKIPRTQKRADGSYFSWIGTRKQPRFRVKLNIGRRFELWIAGIEKISRNGE